MARQERSYTPGGPVTLAFHQSEAFFRGVRGPIGSGKTTACCMELMAMGMKQQPSPIDGWRRTRWAVIRNTYRQLEISTIKSWLELFPPEHFGPFKRTPPFRHLMRDPVQKLEIDVYFIALDNDDNIRDLLSTEWTGMFINEAREVPKSLVDNIVSRARRYPPMDHGGPTRPGVIADTNAPGTDHWWPILCGDMPPPDHWSEEQKAIYVKPPGWDFFSQPPAIYEHIEGGRILGYKVNPNAENLKNLHPDYYKEQWQGKEKDWIDVYLMNRYKTLRHGKPVYPDFNQDVHIASKVLEYSPHLDTFLGVDFGLTPAAVLIQRTPAGQYMLIEEWVTTDKTLPQFFAELARSLYEMGVADDTLDAWGDPAGDFRDQQGDTAFGLARAAGVTLKIAPSNDPSVRVGAVTGLLTRMIGGAPALLVSPRCHYSTQGFIHGYHYRRVRVVGDRFEEKPFKGPYSHVHDAIQYAVLGAGEGRKLMGAREALVVHATRATRNGDIWGRHRPGLAHRR